MIIIRTQSCTHLSQINTLGPATTCNASVLDFPQNEQWTCSAIAGAVVISMLILARFGSDAFVKFAKRGAKLLDQLARLPGWMHLGSQYFNLALYGTTGRLQLLDARS